MKATLSVLLERARQARLAGDWIESHKLFIEARNALDVSNLDDLADLWAAVSMERLGDFDPDERDKEGYRLLKLLAAAGNLRAQEVLMMQYLEGTNGTPKSTDDALIWARVAARNGSLLAASELKKLSA